MNDITKLARSKDNVPNSDKNLHACMSCKLLLSAS